MEKRTPLYLLVNEELAGIDREISLLVSLLEGDLVIG